MENVAVREALRLLIVLGLLNYVISTNPKHQASSHKRSSSCLTSAAPQFNWTLPLQVCAALHGKATPACTELVKTG